jgi:hypothetical protein
MLRVSWQDFEAKSALQRDTLERAMPMVETSTTDDWSDLINMADPADPGYLTIGPHPIFEGATPESCVELLALRPLLFGTAWTVLDFLLEEALASAGQTPDLANGNWSIDRKRRHARAGAGQPATISALAWQALMVTYAETSELRHSLVHRAAFTDPATQALVGHDRNGGKLRPMSVVEQEAFVRAVLRAGGLVTAVVREERHEDDLVHQLGQLTGIHRIPLPRLPAGLRLSRLTVIIPADPANPSRYLLDVPAVKAEWGQPDRRWVDLTVRFPDRPGQELRGRLEHAPDATVSIDAAAPPSWLSS